MPERYKVWQVLLVAAVMVLATGAAFKMGRENEPTVPEHGLLTYSINVTVDDATVHGTQTMTYAWIDGFGWDVQVGMDWQESLWGNGSGPMVHTVFDGGSALLDQMELETPFGIRSVCRYISLSGGYGMAEGGPEIRVTYSGCGSLLTYREEVITSVYRATFILIEVDFTEICGIDLRPSYEVPWIGCPDHAGGVTLHGAFDSDMVRTDDLEYEVNATNYAHYYFGQEDVMAMVDCGGFRYNEGRSVIGNGSLEFRATDEWFLRFVGPVGDAPHAFTMYVRVV
ncbi:MAG: hypothetical protein JXA45_01425 [Methanomassiliicoccales archaeon]|nr:hypothetical protein [Methanomassiliicoccales archaeon]